jgi:hypothetical protein
MTTRLYTLVFVLLSGMLAAQPSRDAKRDWNWAVSGHILNFQNGTNLRYIPRHDTIPVYRVGDMMSDTAGNPLLLTNGLNICDSSGNVILNGNTLDSGSYHRNWYLFGIAIPDNGIWLTDPASDNAFYYIYYKTNVLNFGSIYSTNEVWSAKITLYPNPILVEQHILIRDTFPEGKATACRHANGRDWWVLAPKLNSNVYYKIYIGLNGPLCLGQQAIGNNYSCTLAGMCFSPNGTKLLDIYPQEMNVIGHIRVFDFDRCSGMLSNSKEWPYVDNAVSWSCAISSNSLYGYIIAQTMIYQIDLNTATNHSDMIPVATLSQSDIDNDSLFWRFSSRLGPDGKIYIANDYGRMSYIDFPDSPGTACHVVKRTSGYFPGGTIRSIPAYVNFSLGRLVGSPCDTILYTSMPGKEESSFTVYPNPATSAIHIAMNGPDIGTGQYVSVLDLQGRVLISPAWFRTDADIDIGLLSNGMYLIRIESDTGGVAYQKLVVGK